jgi:peptide/nickel transport system substrate-binding protein
MGMTGHLKRLLALSMAIGALMAGLIVAAPTTGSAGAATPTTATWAEAPQATPNFILPYYPAQLCSVNNVEQFQFLMYRPLYWFGVGTSPNVNTSLSVGKTPTFSGDTVTVDLKNYKWSNGESVTAQDVLFFMNIYHAEPTNF